MTDPQKQRPIKCPTAHNASSYRQMDKQRGAFCLKNRSFSELDIYCLQRMIAVEMFTRLVVRTNVCHYTV